MSETQGRERFLAKMAGQETDRMPVFCADQTATYEQMEEMQAFWPEAHCQAAEMARLALGAYTVLGFDAVRVPFCQTIEAEVLGAKPKYAGKEGLPSIVEHPYKIGDPVQPLPDNFLSLGRIPELLEAVRILKRDVGGRAAVIGGIIGPYSIAASLVGITDILKTAFKYPERLVPYLDLAEQAGTVLGKALIEAGADAICIEDMMASMDMISPKIYRTCVFDWEKRQIAALSAVPTILHICGKLDPIIDDIAQTGVTAISVEPKVNAAEAKEKLRGYGRFIPLIGGIDAVTTLFGGRPEDVELAAVAAAREGYDMLAPGCSIAPGSPLGNLRAMVSGAAKAAG
jgi:[methyl-Co(III) methanol-specific corrinoid protein]:coenzyme M methyltransferase